MWLPRLSGSSTMRSQRASHGSFPIFSAASERRMPSYSSLECLVM